MQHPSQLDPGETHQNHQNHPNHFFITTILGSKE